MQILENFHFKELFEALPDGVVIIDSQTQLPVAYNRAAYTNLEYEKSEFAKLKISDYEMIESPEEIQQHIETLTKSGRDDFETKHKTKHGKLLDIRVTVVTYLLNDKTYLLCTFRDITEQKIVEAALKKSEERLTIATESANIGVWEYDIKNDSLIWNAKMYQIYGIEIDKFSGAYEAWRSALHPEDLEYSTNLFAKSLEDPSIIFDAEFRILWPDGTLRYIKANSKIIRDNNGEALRAIGVNFDITDLKSAQYKLQEREEQFRVIFEKANCGIAYGDDNGSLILCNDYFASMVGYSHDELSQMNFSELTHPDDIHSEIELFKEIVEQKRDGYRIKKRYICKNGKIIWVDLAVNVIRDASGKAVNYLGAVIDITKEKLLEEENAQKEKRFRDVAEAAGEYIWELDMNGQYTFLTKPFEDMLGYPIHEGLGRTPFSFMPHDEEVRVSEFFLGKVVARGIPFRGLVHKSLTKDGKIVWQKVNGLPMFDTDGKIIGYRGAARDITSEKLAQEKLEAATARAEAANSAKTQFLANMSHEIRTPMNAVIGLGEILADMLEEPKQREILSKINSSSKMLLGIINDILDYSKIEAGKLELEYEKFHLDEVLSQLKIMFENKVAQKGIELYFYPKGEDPGLILGDKLRLTQVLTNLLSNAVKFTEKGTITLTIELLEIHEDKRAAFLFSVADSGVGISPEHLGKLFKPFSQADSSTTRKYGGTGLGLVITRNIIKAMGSYNFVQSEIGVGTKITFTLEFNLASCAIDKKVKKEIKAKVLIVDDQEISRQILKNILERFDCAYEEASNGLEAIELIKIADKKSSPYDILLIDWNMPHLDGAQTIKTVQTMYAQKELKTKVPTIFMVSGYNKNEINLKDIQIDKFISKPVTSSLLFNAIIETKNKHLTIFQDSSIDDAPSLEGVNILVVEDNEINQDVISLMLKAVGATFKIANNGKEGVETFLKHQKEFDLILMDLQMPIMSGYEATKEIRVHDAHIPIIALTAAAMDDDKERVMSVGMNEHISKPIDKKKLYETISRLIHNKKTQQKDEQKIQKVLDMDYLIHTLGSNSQAKTLLLKLKNQLIQGEFKDIIHQLKSKSPQSGQTIHALKGVCGNMGALELHQILASLDAKQKKSEPPTPNDIEQLEMALGNLLSELDLLSNQENHQAIVKKLSNSELIKLISDTKIFLKAGELIGEETITTLVQNLSHMINMDELNK